MQWRHPEKKYHLTDGLEREACKPGWMIYSCSDSDTLFTKRSDQKKIAPVIVFLPVIIIFQEFSRKILAPPMHLTVLKESNHSIWLTPFGCALQLLLSTRDVAITHYCGDGDKHVLLLKLNYQSFVSVIRWISNCKPRIKWKKKTVKILRPNAVLLV